MVQHLGALRMAFRIARRERPFTFEAIVILPEHLHAIWTLPSGDSDFSGRWKRIKCVGRNKRSAAKRIAPPYANERRAGRRKAFRLLRPTSFSFRMVCSQKHVGRISEA